MSELSFPIENEPMPGSSWSAVTKGIGNGIIDEGGVPYRLVFQSDANATNQGILKCPTLEGKKYGQAILEGFYHKYDADITLDFPAVTTATRYYVVLQFVPTRVTEGGLPVKVEVVKSLDYTSGKNYLHLYNVDRQPNQLLTEATVRSLRPRVAPVQVYGSYDRLPLARKVLWGTVAVVHNDTTKDEVQFYQSVSDTSDAADEDRRWKLIYDQAADKDKTFTWQTRDYTDTYEYKGSGHRWAIGRRGKRRAMRGRVGLTGDRQFVNRTAPYIVWNGTVAPEDRPSSNNKFVTATNSQGGGQIAIVEVESAGNVKVWVTGNVDWVGFDGIEWEVP